SRYDSVWCIFVGELREATITFSSRLVVAAVRTSASALARLLDARAHKREQFVQRREVKLSTRVDLIDPTGESPLPRVGVGAEPEHERVSRTDISVRRAPGTARETGV